VIPISDRNPTFRRPIVTVLLIAACALVYFLVQPTPFASTKDDAVFDAQHAAIPFEVTHKRPIDVCQFAATMKNTGAAVKPCR
jgi:membrane associated rhomboid family serine protease